MINKPQAEPAPDVYPPPPSSKPPVFPFEYKEDFIAKEPKLIKVVIDTNVYISAIIFGGNPRKVIELTKDQRIKAYTSLLILLEVANKLNNKFKWNREKVEIVLKAISKITEVIEPKIKLKVVKEDPSDNKILECAVVANADYIVTGDKHLLKIKEFEEVNKFVSGEIKIVTTADFLKILK